LVVEGDGWKPVHFFEARVEYWSSVGEKAEKWTQKRGKRWIAWLKKGGSPRGKK